MQYDIKHHVDVQAQAAGAVIFNNSNEVLLVQELVGSKKGLWHIPSGSIEPSEFPQEAALREIEEETGLQVELVCYLNTYVGRFDDGELVLRHVWLSEYDRNQKISPRLNQEIAKATFFTQEAVRELYKHDKLRMHHTFLMIEDAFTLRKKMAIQD